MSPPRTPDNRYIVVDGILWRATRPDLAEPERARLVKALMAARRAVRDARDDAEARRYLEELADPIPAAAAAEWLLGWLHRRTGQRPTGGR